jgi:hypothetical protein
LLINRSDVSDAGISRLSGEHDLECISGFLTDIKGDCFKTFSQFKNLRYVAFYDDAIKEENLKYLSACPNLSYVDLHHTGMSELGVSYLSHCSNISDLRIQGNPKINDAAIKHLLNLKHLTWLTLEGTGTTFTGLQQLKPLKLDHLRISEGSCDAKDLPRLKALARNVEIVPRSHSVGTNMQQILAPLHE